MGAAGQADFRRTARQIHDAFWTWYGAGPELRAPGRGGPCGEEMSAGLLRSTLWVSSMTGLSRCLGLVRDIVFARLFGAGGDMDAFIVAFRIPNFFRRLFAEGAFTQAFVPVLSWYRTRRSDAQVQALLDQVATSLGLVLLALTALGILLAPVLILVFAPGFDGEGMRRDTATQMLRITFPYLLFISLTALAAGVLNTWQQFAAPAFTPALLNITLILCALYLSPHMAQPIVALAWGVFLAGAVQLVFQLPFLLRIGKLPRFSLSRDRDGAWRVLRLMLPALFASSVVQINLLVDTLMASFLAAGSISWLYYSDRLMQFPLGVFGISLATVLLPRLAREHAAGDIRLFTRTMDWGLRWTALIAAPASLGLICLAEPLLVTFFRYQAFSQQDVIMAAGSLNAYCWGLCAFVLVKILAAGFFSRQAMGLPMRAALAAVCCNIIGNLLLIVPFAHVGLALSSSLAAWLHACLLYHFLRKDGKLVLQPGWRRFLLQVTVALGAMVIVLQILLALLGDWQGWSFQGRLAVLLGLVLAGKLSYCAALYFLGLRWRSLMARP